MSAMAVPYIDPMAHMRWLAELQTLTYAWAGWEGQTVATLASCNASVQSGAQHELDYYQ